MNGTRTRRVRLASVAAALAATLIGQTALAAGTPEQKCEGGKNDVSGKYAACLGKARKALVTTGDSAKYMVSLGKCEAKIIGSFSKLEAGAASVGAMCPTSSDEPAIEDFVDACSASIATALGGTDIGPDPLSCTSDLATCDSDLSGCVDVLALCEGLLPPCEADLADATADLAACDEDLVDCEGTTARIPKTGMTQCYNDVGTLIACAGSGRDGEYQAGTEAHLVDNGDGTITDYLTGLMWEKLSDDGTIHDKDNQYAGQNAAIAKATTLNGDAFAGYTDWRLPNVRELGSLPVYSGTAIAVPPLFNTGCTAGSTVLTGSCTKAHIYLSSTAYKYYPSAIWAFNMQDGDQYAIYATDTYYARAVRTLN